MGDCWDTENESLNNREMLLLSLTLLLFYWSHEISADQSPSRNCISHPGVVVGSVFAVRAWSYVWELVWHRHRCSHYSMSRSLLDLLLVSYLMILVVHSIAVWRHLLHISNSILTLQEAYILLLKAQQGKKFIKYYQNLYTQKASQLSSWAFLPSCFCRNLIAKSIAKKNVHKYENTRLRPRYRSVSA